MFHDFIKCSEGFCYIMKYKNLAKQIFFYLQQIIWL